ncbi:MAG: pyridoxal 5'-phosphate synthase glutaminase subunit PdxT [Archaeoglobaceae archaeon]|nr:pyridoxal 5'-phosphate synthase glutaminase subunit PdxT [Archaeoglobaceae archaeon]MDW7989353.1 pyridoxal 5'-phosphate synthase glutaminase subunit PdxT [Archaeoglobaceae archaeon]
MKVSVVGVQGDVEEHVIITKKAMQNLGIKGDVIITRKFGAVSKSDVVIIPGGESTTISKLIFADSIAEEIIQLAESGKPIMGTCAGLIILSRFGDEQVEKTRTKLLGLLDVKVRRNAFGRQKESFQTKLQMKRIGEIDAIFIRAPVIEDVGEKVEILAKFEDKIVAVQQDNILGLAFHPELVSTKVHEYLLSLAHNL